ncbi:MAG TPA: thioredoxin family protein, partial [Clostridiales bacterium]|nr:thioredoxin family protein [Clostridiales bacterium]
MGLFGKKETTTGSNAPVKVLGSGCAKCNQLEASV